MCASRDRHTFVACEENRLNNIVSRVSATTVSRDYGIRIHIAPQLSGERSGNTRVALLFRGSGTFRMFHHPAERPRRKFGTFLEFSSFTGVPERFWTRNVPGTRSRPLCSEHSSYTWKLRMSPVSCPSTPTRDACWHQNIFQEFHGQRHCVVFPLGPGKDFFRSAGKFFTGKFLTTA